MKSRGREVSVILPCAGMGTRFNAAYPKELHQVTADKAVLDLALEPLLELAQEGYHVRVICVVNKHKMQTIQYLWKYAAQLELLFIYQTPRHGDDLAGALRAAAPLVSGDVVLMLADQYVEEHMGNCIRDALEHLRTSPWALVAAFETCPEVLRQEGALRLIPRGTNWFVEAAADKPSDPSGYNAVWAILACRPEQVDLMPATLGEPHGGPSPLVDAPVVVVPFYVNATRPEQLRHA